MKTLFHPDNAAIVTVVAILIPVFVALLFVSVTKALILAAIAAIIVRHRVLVRRRRRAVQQKYRRDTWGY